jgi:hypothetical protein
LLKYHQWILVEIRGKKKRIKGSAVFLILGVKFGGKRLHGCANLRVFARPPLIWAGEWAAFVVGERLGGRICTH